MGTRASPPRVFCFVSSTATVTTNPHLGAYYCAQWLGGGFVCGGGRFVFTHLETKYIIIRIIKKIIIMATTIWRQFSKERFIFVVGEKDTLVKLTCALKRYTYY